MKKNLLAVFLFVAAWTLIPSAWAADYYWIVWGTGQADGGAKPHQWGPDQDTDSDARALMSQTLKDHAKGGLLETDPDKPIKLEIVKVDRATGKKIKVDPPDSKVPPATLSDKKGMEKAPGGTKGTSIAGRQAKGKIGDTVVTIKFLGSGDKGILVIIAGDSQVRGQWEQMDNGAVYLKTPNATFRGSIKGNTLSGQRFWKDDSVPMTAWNVELTPVDPIGKVATNEQKDKLQLAGTYWGADNKLFGLRFLRFTADDKVEGSFHPEASKHDGVWKQVGPNSIECDFGGSLGKYSVTVNGGDLSVKQGDSSFRMSRK